MQIRLSRLDISAGAKLATPFFTMTSRIAEIAEAFYRSLAPRHTLSPSDFGTDSANSFGEVKMTITLYRGRGSLVISPEGLMWDFRDLIRDESDVDTIRDLLLTCEQTYLSLARQSDGDAIHVLQHDVRGNFWVESVGGQQEAFEWLDALGAASFGKFPSFHNWSPDFTLQFNLGSPGGEENIGLGVQRSKVGAGHLFLAAQYQTVKKMEPLPPINVAVDQARSRVTEAMKEIGLDWEVNDVGT